MFDELIKKLEQLDGATISIPLEVNPDEDGYIDRQCPAENCEFLFKVLERDWADRVLDESVWCPFCGHVAPSDQWWTHAQIEHGKEIAVAEVRQSLNRAMKKGADRWNRRQPRNSFISMTMKVDTLPREVVLPATASEAMQLKIKCSECSCQYAVIGSAYFCPACGHNAASHVFSQSLATIRSTIENLEEIERGVADRDAAKNTTLLLIEHALQRAVTAFQRFAEAQLERHPAAPKTRRNVFQNLQEGSKVWESAYGSRYDSHLTHDQMDTLIICFQQRHLLAHREGLVDSDYITRTQDDTYREGQRIVVTTQSVVRCVDLIETLATGLCTDADKFLATKITPQT